MITERDLQEAIAECQGVRNPTASTAIKLAAFLTIQKELYGTEPTYSYDAPPAENTPIYDSGTRFGEIVQKMPTADVYAVFDDLMTTLAAINPRLYNGVIRELEDGRH